mmetsp:Transcript_42021/g.76305  ORF Transcript_42021/g.76305 Transcript_42021/m.76305 type:complete len:206 (-) Transcript_42021:53-670(-)
MGGCESCASPRRRDAAVYLKQQMSTSLSAEELRKAIAEAESHGVVDPQARRQYSELAATERESPDNVANMLEWAMAMQDGAMLRAVIQKCSDLSPNHQDLHRARAKLVALHKDSERRMARQANIRNVSGLAKEVERAKKMGVEGKELEKAEQVLRQLQAETARNALQLHKPEELADNVVAEDGEDDEDDDVVSRKSSPQVSQAPR